MKERNSITPQERLNMYKAEFFGLAELAIILGISKQACSNRRGRNKLPAPTVELALGPVWHRSIIEQFLKETHNA